MSFSQSKTNNRDQSGRGKQRGGAQDTTKGKDNSDIVLRTNSVEDTLNKIKVDGALATLLSRLNSTIVVEIGSSGTVISVVRKDGKPSCSLTELRKVNSFRGTIANNNELASNSKALEPMLKAIWKLRLRDGRDIKNAHMSSVAAVACKEVIRLVDNVQSNIQRLLVIDGVDTTADTRAFLIEQGKKIIVVLAHDLTTHERGSFRKEEHNAALNEAGVTKWVFNKLTSGEIVSQTTMVNTTRLLFPIDSYKGVTYTVEELLNEEFRAKNLIVLAKSDPLINFISDEGMVVKHILPTYKGITDTSAETQLFKEQPLNALNIINNVDEFMDPKLKGKFISNEVIIPGTMTANCRKVNRAFQNVSQLEPRTLNNPYEQLWTHVLHGNRLPDSCNNTAQNIFVAVSVTPNFKVRIGEFLQQETQEMKVIFKDLLKSELNMIREPTGGLIQILGRQINHVGIYNLDMARYEREILLFKKTSGMEQQTFDQLKKKIAPVKAAKNKVAKTFVMPICLAVRDYIAEYKDTIPEDLTLELTEFVMGFSTPEMQRVAAERAIASIGQIDSNIESDFSDEAL